MNLAPLRSDTNKTKTLYGYRLMPIKQYKSVVPGRHLHLVTNEQLIRVMVTSVRTWVKRGHPREGHTEIHMKFGLYTHLTISSDNLDDNLRAVLLNGVVVKQYPMGKTPEMTKGDLFKEMECTFDYSLPQMVLNDMVRLSGLPYHTILSSTVWAYPEEHRLSGAPVSCVTEIQAAWDQHFPSVNIEDK